MTICWQWSDYRTPGVFVGAEIRKALIFLHFFPSVNLLAMPTVVRIHPPPPKRKSLEKSRLFSLFKDRNTAVCAQLLKRKLRYF